jgi:hypothetical protein
MMKGDRNVRLLVRRAYGEELKGEQTAHHFRLGTSLPTQPSTLSNPMKSPPSCGRSSPTIAYSVRGLS